MLSGAVLLITASGALAIDPSIKCETDKLRLVAKYTACRLNAEADAAREFGTPDFSKCESSFLAGWTKAEARARSKGAPCWTEGDAEVVKGSIDSHTGSLAENLGGGDQ
jgi:hypothetical protein